jgi:hypothetical protein
MDEREARALAAAANGAQLLGPARELRDGWFFPGTIGIGSNGVIVNKASGAVLELGSLFPAERDIALYERGWRHEPCELTIAKVRDVDATASVLSRLNLMTIAPNPGHPRAPAVARRLRETEIRQRLQALPCSFSEVDLYFTFEVLDEARNRRWFTFETRPSWPG